MKYIFLDRDGVINKEIDHLNKIEQVELIPRSANAIKLLNENNYSIIIITNQAAIAKGLLTEKGLEDIHLHLRKLLEKEGAQITKIYFCPHHPETEYSGLKKCACRKPNPGLLLEAQKALGIPELQKCYMIGDKTSDIAAGAAVGCKTILVNTGYAGKDREVEAKPNFIAQDLYDAVTRIILK